MGFKQCLGIAAAGLVALRISDLHSHSKESALPPSKDLAISCCRAVAPIEVLVEDSLQCDLIAPKAVVWQPLWSR